MKKRFLAIILCLVMSLCLFAFVGCSNNKEREKDIKVRISDNYIQWSYDGDAWTNLLSIEDVKNAVDDDIGSGAGEDGKEIELQVTSEEIQWRYAGEDWQTLIALSELKGEKGKDGSNGSNGSNGTNGTNGINGTDGATWLTGESVPLSTLGKNGDLYLNTSTNDVYKKSNNAWAVICTINGSSGGNGKEIELQVTSEEIQWRYAGEDWQTLIALSELKGEKGKDGSNGSNGSNGTNGTNGINGTDGATWLTGESVPLSTLGKNGDLYLNTSTNDVYKKSNNAWAVVCNIAGESGVSITGVSFVQTVDNVDKYRIDFSEGESFIFSVMNGIDATYSTYKVKLEYGTHAGWFTSSTTTEISVKSTEWLTGLPIIESKYSTNFLGWYIKDTDKKIENYDFVGGSVTLEAKYLEPGLYQNGVLIKSWEQLKIEYPNAIGVSTIYNNNSESYFKTLSGEFVISPDITVLYLRSFKNCMGLTSIVIPNSVTEICEWTFDNCTNLTSISLPASLTYISSKTFENCCSLKSVSIDKNNTTYKTDGKAIFSIDGTELITYVANASTQSYYIPEGVTKISGNAFTGTTNFLETIVLPSTITKIDEGAFAYCLCTTVEVTNNITEIGSYAFMYCSNLREITIASSVTKIGQATFQGCDSLEKIYFISASNWYYTSNSNYVDGTKMEAGSPEDYANNLTNLYKSYYWYKVKE